MTLQYNLENVFTAMVTLRRKTLLCIDETKSNYVLFNLLYLIVVNCSQQAASIITKFIFLFFNGNIIYCIVLFFSDIAVLTFLRKNQTTQKNISILHQTTRWYPAPDVIFLCFFLISQILYFIFTFFWTWAELHVCGPGSTYIS